MPTDLDAIQWELPATREYGERVRATELPGPWLAEDVWTRDKRTWTLEASMMPTSEADDLRTVFDACRGGAGSTFVTPPGEVSQVEVEFVDDTLTVERVGGDVWRATVRVREVV